MIRKALQYAYVLQATKKRSLFPLRNIADFYLVHYCKSHMYEKCIEKLIEIMDGYPDKTPGMYAVYKGLSVVYAIESADNPYTDWELSDENDRYADKLMLFEYSKFDSCDIQNVLPPRIEDVYGDREQLVAYKKKLEQIRGEVSNRHSEVVSIMISIIKEWIDEDCC